MHSEKYINTYMELGREGQGPGPLLTTRSYSVPWCRSTSNHIKCAPPPRISVTFHPTPLKDVGEFLISIMIMPLCQLLLLFLPLVTYAQNYTTVLMSNTTKIMLEKCFSTLPQFWIFLSFRRSGSGWRDNSVTNLIPNPGQCAFVYTQQIGDAVTFKFTGMCYP